MFEMASAAILLVLGLPVLMVGAAAVWWVAGRPVFFAHRRVGRGGRPFSCWKLRTMQVGAEEALGQDEALRRKHRAQGFKLPESEDPRVIARLEWIRRSHIDELPQLVNVLRGDMSLIGPRPVVHEELACYGSEWTTLVSRRPGVVGAWTAMGRARPPYPERARIEIEYVRGAGLGADLSILLRTLLLPFRRRTRG
jgi:lipopolysaccharide/colanic/teichoic acid biosynthesis glycosyltransferase